MALSKLDEEERRLASADEELPIVARLVIEVRSNGTRTVARGAMEDAQSGTKAAIEARGGTPLELALTLARSILAVPFLSRTLGRRPIRELLKRK
jgi:hypothetical protein